MSDNDTVYYIAAGRSLAKCEAWAEMRKRSRERRLAFVQRIGAVDLFGWSDGTHMWGIIYDDASKVVPGLRRHRDHERVYIPARATKAGKALARELDALGDERDFGGREYVGNGRIHTPGVRLMEGKYVILQNEKAEPPDDAIPLKRSEFWAMVERHEAAKTIAEPVNA